MVQFLMREKFDKLVFNKYNNDEAVASTALAITGRNIW